MKRLFLFSGLLALLAMYNHALFSQTQLGATIPGEMVGGEFGRNVSLSEDGKRVAIGTPVGQYVKVYDLVAGNWVQIGTTLYGDSAETHFGRSVSLSGNGNRLAIGVPAYRSNPQNFISNGYVKVYELISSNWVQLGPPILGQPTINQGLGVAVSFSYDGNRLAIGGTGYDRGRGHARVFDWIGGNWRQVGSSMIGESTGAAFGWHLSLSSDGKRLAVGAPWNHKNGLSKGHVRVFEWKGGSWTKMGDDIDGKYVDTHLGEEVSLSADGNRVAIGGPFQGINGINSGHIQVFDWVNGTWQQVGSDINGDATGDILGYTVSISSDGNRLVAGIPGRDNNGINAGAARIYELIGNTWVQLGLEINGDTSFSAGGWGVYISGNGEYVSFGEPNFQASTGGMKGQVRIFSLNGLLQKGQILFDDNPNCLVDSTESGFPNLPISFQKQNGLTKGYSNEEGRFAALLDTGTYHVSLNLDKFPYHKSCPPSQQIIIDTSKLHYPEINFLIQDSILCPLMTVEISAIFIRRCFPGKYEVSYCNHGTEDATKAYVELELDPHLTYTSSSVPLTRQIGNILQFQLPTVNAVSCNSFQVYFTENCKSEFRQVHCTSAHIYPDSICAGDLPNTRIGSFCQGDTLQYDITNLGDDFPHALPYLILDDTAIVDTGSFFLTKGQHQNITFPLHDTARMYQLVIAPEDPAYYTATGLKGCRQSAFNTSFLYLPGAPSTKFQDTDCQTNRGSFDPNDKQATPPGAGPHHHLKPNSPLEYHIRFQNTGTDTAFTVYILDTLSAHLDIAQFQTGTASHPYQLTMLPPTAADEHILLFEFDSILLPDSATNQEASNGFVKFQIQMKPSLPLSTVIENDAAIYFDYNEAVLTNTVFHTLHQPSYTLCKPGKAVDEIATCHPFTWINGKTYTSSNDKARHILAGAAANGCDSIVTLNLTIDSIDVSVLDLTPNLQALATHSIFQWVDCNKGYSPIHGATSATFRPAINGSYAVLIGRNGCVDTSACYNVTNVGLPQNEFGDALQVFPNPTDNQLHIDLGSVYQNVTIRLTNALGQVVAEKQYGNLKETQIEVKGTTGLYLLEIRTQEGTSAVVKVLKR